MAKILSVRIAGNGEWAEYRAEVLARVAEKPLQRLFQFDGFVEDTKAIGHDGPLSAEVAALFPKGYDLFQSITDELRSSGPELAVRIHIMPQAASKEQVLFLLDALRDWIAREYDRKKWSEVCNSFERHKSLEYFAPELCSELEAKNIGQGIEMAKKGLKVNLEYGGVHCYDPWCAVCAEEFFMGGDCISVTDADGAGYGYICPGCADQGRTGMLEALASKKLSKARRRLLKAMLRADWPDYDEYRQKSELETLGLRLLGLPLEDCLLVCKLATELCRRLEPEYEVEGEIPF